MNNSTPIYKIPWTGIIAVLLAFTALGINEDGSIFLPILGIALLLSRFINGRLPYNTWAPWVIRIVAFGIIGSHVDRTENGGVNVFGQSTIDVCAQICAVETVLQAWLDRPFGKPPGTSIILLSGIVLLAASGTYDDRYIKFIVPGYILFVTLSFRKYNLSGTNYKAHPIHRPVLIARAIALLIALALGFGTYLGFTDNKQRLASLETDIFLHRQLQIPQKTGLSTAPTLGSMFDSNGSPTRVLRIVNPAGEMHLRGMAFDTYARNSWLPTYEQRQFVDATPAQLQSRAPGIHSHVTCYSEGLKLLIAPLNVAGIVPPEGVVERTPALGNLLQTHASTPYYYDIILPKNENGQGIISLPPTPNERVKCLNVPPEIDPKVRALALLVTAGLSNPKDKIQAITTYLISHYTYKLTAHNGSGDKISYFLLHEKSGHCEFFASAAVIMLRCVGVPTRYATGYYAHEFGVGNEIIVRQRDSHAWAESWVDGTGWMTVDATPGGGRPDKLYPDMGLRVKFLETIADRIDDLRHYLMRFSPAQISAVITALGCLYFAITWWGRRRKRKGAADEERRYSTPDQDLHKLGLRFDAFLNGAGMPCPDQLTWRQHLEQMRVSTEEPIKFDDAAEFIQRYNRLRFRHEIDSSLLTETTALMETLEKGQRKPHHAK